MLIGRELKQILLLENELNDLHAFVVLINSVKLAAQSFRDCYDLKAFSYVYITLIISYMFTIYNLIINKNNFHAFQNIKRENIDGNRTVILDQKEEGRFLAKEVTPDYYKPHLFYRSCLIIFCQIQK